jgi:hypothetical protein
MRKVTITRTWLSGVIVSAVGLIIAGVGVALMLTHGGQWEQVAGTNNWNFTPTTNGFFWTTVTLIVLGGLVMLAGMVVQFVAWIGALVNTRRLKDLTWFIILLVGGLLGFVSGLIGLGVMIAYLIGGPDGMAIDQPWRPISQPPTAQPPTLAPTM